MAAAVRGGGGEGGGGGGGGINDVDGAEKSAFRWLDAARYVVSAVVVVLIVAVAARAIAVVLRPDQLSLSVPESSVFTQWVWNTSSSAGTTRAGHGHKKGDLLSMQFSLLVQNPSGRARMYYYNISAYLFDDTTMPAPESRNPGEESLAYFVTDDLILQQANFYEATVESSNVSRNPDQLSVTFFDRLNSGVRIGNATMRVDGTVVSEIIRSGYNTTPQLTTYYCRNLIVGVDVADRASMSSQETTCTTYYQ